MFEGLIGELTGQSAAVLDNALAMAKRKRDEADLEIAAITAVVENSRAFEDHGHRSVTGYLKQQLNCGAAEAARIRDRGRLLVAYPDIADALGSSRLGAAQADRLAKAHRHARAGARFGEFAALLTDKAERLEYADFVQAVTYFENLADPNGAFDEQMFHEDQRTASVSVVDGAVHVHASGGDPVRAAEMKRIFDDAVDAQFEIDCAARRDLHGDDALAFPLDRDANQRRFDALHEIFMASVTTPADGQRPEPLVNLVIDAATGLEVLAAHGLIDIDEDASVDPTSRRAATSTGVSVHSDQILQAMLRGRIRRVIVDAHDVVIDMGRTQRLFTGKAREAAQLLVTRCGHRGCDVPAEFCDIDHVDEWSSHGGGTDQANALPLCGTHDRWKHKQGLRGRRDRFGRIHLIRPDGRVIKPLNARDPDWGEPAAA